MIELLSPAGNLKKLEYALKYGADAVYIGGPKFSLRSAANNFSLEDIKKGIEIVRKKGKRIYVAINVFAHQHDLVELSRYLEKLAALEPDALIIADPGILRIAKRICPNINIHVSTQANVTNIEAALFWAEMGVKRITLARELSLEEIKKINEALSIETEVFIHGAMCLSYSGRCWLSSHIKSRDANRGDCAQNCRWNYVLIEEERKEEAMRVFEEDGSSHILSSKDLCLAQEIPKIIDAGATSLKIEGRMKSIHYVATVTKTYRQIIDSIIDKKNKYVFENRWMDELNKISHRQYCKGFLEGKDDELQVDGRTSYIKTAEFVAEIVESSNEQSKVLIKNRTYSNEELEVLMPDGDNKKAKMEFFDDEDNKKEIVHANEIVFVKQKWPVKALLRREKLDD